MLRGFFGALFRGLRAMVAGAVGLCGDCVSALWAMFGFGPSPMALPELDIDEWKALKQPLRTAEEVAQSQMREPSHAYAYAVDCVCDRARAPTPKVSKATAAWLRGLDYGELETLANAGPEAISGHMRGQYIAGVPRVQPLPERELAPPPASLFTADDDDLELSAEQAVRRAAA